MERWVFFYLLIYFGCSTADIPVEDILLARNQSSERETFYYRPSTFAGILAVEWPWQNVLFVAYNEKEGGNCEWVWSSSVGGIELKTIFLNWASLLPNWGSPSSDSDEVQMVFFTWASSHIFFPCIFCVYSFVVQHHWQLGFDFTQQQCQWLVDNLLKNQRNHSFVPW